MMEQKLTYLRKFKKDVHIRSVHGMTDVERGKLPESWLDVFQKEQADKRVERVLSIWNEQAGGQLQNTIAYLSDHLVEVELLDTNGVYSILYTIQTSTDELVYYEGGNPEEKWSNEPLEQKWRFIPASIRNVYETLHNGFYFYASHSMGLVPLKSVTFFDDDEWGIIDELEEPLQLNLQTTFGFFQSGTGGYVAVDYENAAHDNATLWWTHKEPRYNLHFWDIVDEWMVIGFEG